MTRVRTPRTTAKVAAVALTISCLSACKARPKPDMEPKEAEEKVEKPEKAAVDAAARTKLLEQTKAMFGTPTPANVTEDPEVEAKLVALGKALYFDTRLSKNHDLSCNSCHDLENYGVDPRKKDGKLTPTSEGHKGQMGARNSPTVYNAYLHASQFWDGRAADVEEQAKGPVLNPVEMAMVGSKEAIATLRSIPGYKAMFKAAFPKDKRPINWDNFAKAVGAFERKLVTPAPVDAFFSGDLDALTDAQARGFQLFAERCASCHMGPSFGGAIFQKLGLMKPYETEDTGRMEVTGKESDKYFFKVPGLRNVAKTAPYMHDGSISDLKEMVAIMGEYQTPQGKPSEEEISDIVAFLEALTGKLPEELIAAPELPESGPKTPKADPS